MNPTNECAALAHLWERVDLLDERLRRTENKLTALLVLGVIASGTGLLEVLGLTLSF